MSAVTASPATELLPDLPGKVHGWKAGEQYTVQCDDCLTLFSGASLILVAHAATFNARSGTDDRLCDECWAKRGWRDGYYGWERTS